MNEKQKFLGRMDLFKALPPEALQRLAAVTNTVYFPDGHLIRETSLPNAADTSDSAGLYVIKSGSAKVSTPASSGQVTAVVAVLREQDWFGEIGLLDGLAPSADVTAMGPMECFFLPRHAFLKALNQYPEIAVSMLPGLGTIARSADQRPALLL